MFFLLLKINLGKKSVYFCIFTFSYIRSIEKVMARVLIFDVEFFADIYVLTT